MDYTETECNEILDGDVALLTFVKLSEDSRRVFVIEITIAQMAWHIAQQAMNCTVNRLKVLVEQYGRRASSS